MQEARKPENNQKVPDLQFEYAWRWFSFHAQQRITMFNFFLLTSGILANAYGLLLRQDLSLPAAAVAAIGFFACATSIGLDVRNHQLVKLGEDVICMIEQNYLFQSTAQAPAENSPRYGILFRESAIKVPLALKHKTLIRSLEVVGLLGFFGAAVYAYCAR